MTSAILNQDTLVLNKNWMPITITKVHRALSMVFIGHAVVLDENFVTHDFKSWSDLSGSMSGGKRILTVTMGLLIPYVIVLTSYNKVPKRKVRLSRRNIYTRDNGTCQYCGKKPSKDEVSIDHIVPRSKGGKSTWTNLILACTPCNIKKSDKMLSESGMTLLKKPDIPRWPMAQAIKIDSEGRGFWQKFVSDAYWNVALEE